MSKPTLSIRFLQALKLGNEPAYKVANRAGVNPTTLSKLVTGAERVRPNDPRIVAVGREMGLTTEECFDVAPVDATAHVPSYPKTYLGDGVFVSHDGYGLVLTTEDGLRETNRIALEPEVYRALVAYVETLLDCQHSQPRSAA